MGSESEWPRHDPAFTCITAWFRWWLRRWWGSYAELGIRFSIVGIWFSVAAGFGDRAGLGGSLCRSCLAGVGGTPRQLWIEFPIGSGIGYGRYEWNDSLGDPSGATATAHGINPAAGGRAECGRSGDGSGGRRTRIGLDRPTRGFSRCIRRPRRGQRTDRRWWRDDAPAWDDRIAVGALQPAGCGSRWCRQRCTELADVAGGWQ
ncbi:hypothetical protein C3477_23705 [Mycobacterium kansasii]|nr:hypothetical protein B1T47_07470 [Mycobacterium kansasii]ORC12852.1 hypothetical protein B1T46_20915 [Mycobacterium kansasii]POX69225.1 hypothetical protein C3475_28020 [Mycobacterium kansasii]POX76365.1 hypothetical protein C3470_24230 [Mycobacterium kansasii]POX78665.1 hypothetical protein C3471_14400 [Mycobacterium kansasii]